MGKDVACRVTSRSSDLEEGEGIIEGRMDRKMFD